MYIATIAPSSAMVRLGTTIRRTSAITRSAAVAATAMSPPASPTPSAAPKAVVSPPSTNDGTLTIASAVNGLPCAATPARPSARYQTSQIPAGTNVTGTSRRRAGSTSRSSPTSASMNSPKPLVMIARTRRIVAATPGLASAVHRAAATPRIPVRSPRRSRSASPRTGPRSRSRTAARPRVTAAAIHGCVARRAMTYTSSATTACSRTSSAR